MLGWRLSVSAILIPILIGLFMIDARIGPAAPVLFLLCLLLGVRGSFEVRGLLRRPGVEPHLQAIAVCVALLLVATWWPHWSGHTSPLLWLTAAYGVCVMGLFLHGAVRYREPGQNIPTLAAEVLAVSYVGLLLCLTAQLRWVDGGTSGYFALGSVIITAKMGDIGAYTLGRLFGRRKMAPLLSPGKTWMGAAGAILGAALGAVVWLCWIGPQLSASWTAWGVGRAAVYGAIVGLAGLIGDLCESLLKRDAGMKDSAALLPGFGGLLDLLDSVLFAGPIAWMLWKSLPPN